MFEFIRMMRKFTMILSIFLLFAGVASAQQQGSGGAKKIDTCALLTKAEIQEAIGKDVQDGKLNPNANLAVGAPCEFVVEPYGAFSLLVKPVGPGEIADRYTIITLLVPEATEPAQKAAAEINLHQFRHLPAPPAGLLFANKPLFLEPLLCLRLSAFFAVWRHASRVSRKRHTFLPCISISIPAAFMAVWASAGAAIMSAAKLIKSIPFPFTGRVIDFLC